MDLPLYREGSLRSRTPACSPRWRELRSGGWGGSSRKKIPQRRTELLHDVGPVLSLRTSHSCCNEFYQQLKLPSRALQQVTRARRAQSSAAALATVLSSVEKLCTPTSSVSPERDWNMVLNFSKASHQPLRVVYILPRCEVFFYLSVSPLGICDSTFDPMKCAHFANWIEWFLSSQGLGLTLHHTSMLNSPI